MAIKSNPADAVSRWRAGVGSAGNRYQTGIQNSGDWAGAATAPAASQARASNWNAAQSSGHIDRRIQSLGTQGWRNATIAKAGNWQTGVNSPMAQQNAQAGFTRLFGYLQQAQSAIAGTPRGGFNENIQRMVAHATAIHDAAQADKAAF